MTESFFLVVWLAASTMSDQDTFVHVLAGQCIGCRLSFGDGYAFATLANESILKRVFHPCGASRSIAAPVRHPIVRVLSIDNYATGISDAVDKHTASAHGERNRHAPFNMLVSVAMDCAVASN